MDPRDQNPPPPPPPLPALPPPLGQPPPPKPPLWQAPPRRSCSPTVPSHRVINPNSRTAIINPPGFGEGSSSSGKKKPGRPRKNAPGVGTSSQPSGSGKKQLDASGTEGNGFTTHVILVHAGQDIEAKIEAFSQEGHRKVFILSANGAVSRVMLKPHSGSGAPISYEGRFEIISLPGYFQGDTGENNRLRASLAGLDGRTFGGGVAGMLVAATRVQVVVGSFVTNGKKPSRRSL